MGYGTRWNEVELEFPALLSDDEIERQINQMAPRPAAQKYRPLDVIRQHYPHVAERLSLLWGGGLFDRYVDMLSDDAKQPGSGFPREVVDAIAALAEKHKSKEGLREGVSSWVKVPGEKNAHYA